MREKNEKEVFFPLTNVSFLIIGMEAVGEVVAVGSGLTGRQIGDLVAYAGNPMGAYAEEQILPADKVVPVPSSIDPIVAASIMLKGMTAQFLLRRCFKVSFSFYSIANFSLIGWKFLIV